MQHSAPANSASQADDDVMMLHSAPAKMGSQTRSRENSETTDEEPTELLRCAIPIVDDPSGVPREHKDINMYSDSTSQASDDCGSYGTHNTHPTAWFSLVNRLWASLEPWPHAEQQNKFIIFKLEQMSTALVPVSVLQSICMLSIARKGGLGLLSLHGVLAACFFTVPIARLVYKRDYLAAEKLIIAWSLWRKVLFYHLHLADSTSIVGTVMHVLRPLRAVLEPIRFQWTVADLLGTLVLDCIVRNGNTVYWILFWHVLSLTTAVVVEIRHRKLFLALEKSQ
eukprot:gene7363-487_t